MITTIELLKMEFWGKKKGHPKSQLVIARDSDGYQKTEAISKSMSEVNLGIASLRLRAYASVRNDELALVAALKEERSLSETFLVYYQE